MIDQGGAGAVRPVLGPVPRRRRRCRRDAHGTERIAVSVVYILLGLVIVVRQRGELRTAASVTASEPVRASMRRATDPSRFDRADGAAPRLADEEFDVLVIGGGITGAGVALDAAARGLRTALVERRATSRRARRRSRRSSSTAGCATCSRRSTCSSTRTWPSASGCWRTRPTSSPAALPHPAVRHGRRRQQDGGQGLLAPRCGCTTSPAASASASATSASPSTRRCAHMPTLRRERLVAGLPLLRRPGRRRPAHADHPAHAPCSTTAPWPPTTRRSSACSKDDGGQRARRPAGGRHRGAGRGRGQRRRRVGRRGPRPRRRRRTPTRSARPRASTSPCRGTSVHVRHRRASCPCPRTGARSSWCRGATASTSAPPTPTTTARSTTPRAPPEDVDYILDAINAVVDDAAHRRPTSLGTWAGLRPLVADARSERTADLSRRHTVVASDSGVVTVTGGKLTTYRKMAADTVDEVVQARLRLGAADQALRSGHRGTTLRLRGADGRSARPAPPRAPAAPLRRRGPHVVAMVEADPITGRAAGRRASPTSGRGRLRGALRDGADPRGRAVSRRTRALLLGARRVGRRRARRRPGWWRAELGWDDAEVDAPGRGVRRRAPRSAPTPTCRETVRRHDDPRGSAHAADRASTPTAVTAALRRRRRRRRRGSSHGCATSARDVGVDEGDAAEARPGLVAARHVLGARRRGAGPAGAPSPRPSTAAEVAAVLRACCNERACRSRPMAGRSGVCGGASRCSAASPSTSSA